MTHESLGSPSPSQAEALLQDPQIQDGLRSVFDELDNLYASIQDQTQYTRDSFVPSLAPDGTFIEASSVALPTPEDRSGFSETDYLVFRFNLADLVDPEFALKPMPIKSVTSSSEGGVKIIADNPNDPEPLIPHAGSAEQGSPHTDEALSALGNPRREWERRNVVHLTLGSLDPIKIGDIETEPVVAVMHRLGVELYQK